MKALSRKEQKEFTRKKLIDTSIKVFARQGISSTNTANLAKKVGVSHGTVFLHFPTRDDLLFSVIDEFGNRLSNRFENIAQGSIGLIEILKAHLNVLEEYEGIYSTLITDLPHLPDKVRSRFFILQASISHRINIEVQKEIESHTLKNIEKHMVFNTWIALIHYYIINKKIFSPKKSVLATFGDTLLKHFLMLINR